MSNLKNKLNKVAFNEEDAYKGVEQIDRNTVNIYDGLENICTILEKDKSVKEALTANGVNADEFYSKINELSLYFDKLSNELRNVLKNINY